ncbi:MAG: T9SS type A sorting domain-containing protein [Candidatus Eisenbacteria bacterium]|nr:T9SS type A sorting domain-containing protein [Candidatus Eisenbacteria bacterium]
MMKSATAVLCCVAAALAAPALVQAGDALLLPEPAGDTGSPKDFGDRQILERAGAWPYGPSFAVALDTQRDLIFLGSGGAVLVLDGTDRTNPTLIYDEIHTAGLVEDAWYDPATQALFLACGTGGLEIWDVSDPAAPSQLSRTEILYFGEETPVGNVIVTGHFAVAECAWGYVQCLDVSDLTNPIQTGFNGSMQNPARDIYFAPEDEQIHSTGAEFYVRLEVTEEGGLNSTGQKQLLPGGPEVVAGEPDVAYVGYDESLVILDLLEPGFPAWATETVGRIEDLVIDGDVLYLTTGDGLQIWDVSVPNTPALLGTLAATLSNGRLTVAEGYAYIADRQNGLRIVEIGDGTAPVQVGSYDVPTICRKAEVLGDYAFVAQASDGLTVLDVSDLEQIELAAQLPMPGESSDFTIAGDLLYMADGDGGLRVVDITDPLAPFEVGSHEAYNIFRVEVGGARAYAIEVVLPSGPHNLHVFDVEDPENITELGMYSFTSTPFAPWELIIDGDYLYVAGDDEGLLVLDVSDPGQITQVAGYAAPAVVGLELVGDLLYVTSFSSYEGGLYIFDVNDPTAPQLIGTYSELGVAPWQVAVAGEYAYISDFSDLVLLDVTDPANPQPLESMELPEFLNDIFIRGAEIFIADFTAGVQIVRNTQIASSLDDGAVDGGLRLQASANPFTGGTAVRYVLPEAAFVTLSVYDVEGRLVRRLHDGRQSAGSHQARWDGRGEDGRAVPAGVYLYRLERAGQAATARVVRLR